MLIKRIVLLLAAVAMLLGVVAQSAMASHTWGGYHWAHTFSPFNLKLGDNLTANWDSHLATTSTDWSVSSVLDTSVVTGLANPKQCRPTAGRVEVCNSKYGINGWLGIASVWASGTHITQGTVKMNDSYFNTAKYNTPAWRNLVLCQEVGHTLGLDHQDEDFANAPLGTCMDYSNDPTLNQHPNAHDYEQLEAIYAHLDTTSTLAQTRGVSAQALSNERGDWGKLVRSRARTDVYERDLGRNQKVFTFVIRP
jgi:hypothetical protein